MAQGKTQANPRGAPPRNASNETLRRFARLRAKACFPQLIAVSLLLLGTVAVPLSLRWLLPQYATWVPAWQLLCLVLFAPLGLGATAGFFEVYVSGALHWKRAFRFYGSGHGMLTCVALTLSLYPFTLAGLLIDHAVPVLKYDRPLFAIVLTVAGWLVSVLRTWLSLRLSLNGYLLGLDSKKSAWQVMKEGFALTRGKVWGILWFGLTILWPMLLLLAGVYIGLPVLVASDWAAVAVPALILVLAAVCVGSLPFLAVAGAGYAWKLIPPEFLRKKTTPPYKHGGVGERQATRQ